MGNGFAPEEWEAFFERHFDCERSDDENRASADRIYAESRKKVSELSRQLMDGEAIDEPTMVFEVASMILAYGYRKKFNHEGG